MTKTNTMNHFVQQARILFDIQFNDEIQVTVVLWRIIFIFHKSLKDINDITYFITGMKTIIIVFKI